MNIPVVCQFNTPFGCYKFNRLPFGVKNAPEVFQKFNEQNFGDIDGVMIYFDDLLIAARDEAEHDRVLKRVIERARQLSVKFNAKKLQYRTFEVKYLGHVFSRDGVKPDPEQVKAIEVLEVVV